MDQQQALAEIERVGVSLIDVAEMSADEIVTLISSIRWGDGDRCSQGELNVIRHAVEVLQESNLRRQR